MNEKSFDFNLNIKTEAETGEAVEISGFDTDFEIIKTNTSETNKASLIIWNLDDSLYQALTEKDNPVCIYAGYGKEEPALVFRGFISKIMKKTGVKSSDFAVFLEISDGKDVYTKAFINKNYRDKVTTSAIIKDCTDAMGLGLGMISTNYQGRTYNSYKAKGFAHCILQRICAAAGLKFSIQNGLVHIVSENDEPVEETAYLLNSENSNCPKRSGKNEMTITTCFTAQIVPNGSVKCEFDVVSGLYKVKSVKISGSNYGRAIIAEVTI